MSRKVVVGALISILLVLVLAVVAGAAAPAMPSAAESVAVASQEVMPAAVMAAAEPEACSVCHKDAGADHQDSYDELYQDGVIQVTDLAYSFAAPDASTVSFKMTKNGAAFNANNADNLAIYFAPYTGEKFQFEGGGERLSLKGKLVYDGEGGVTTTVTGTVDFGAVDGLVVVYGRDEDVGLLPARVYLNKYPFAGLLETGAGVDYVSAANNDGCEKCHTVPYLKHSYIYGQVNQDPATDFYTCKACHLDNGEGGHFEWQLLVDDPLTAAAYLADESLLTPEMAEQYAYSTSLMNDVHMSHAMEFPYPQSMANCTTCHAGKLDMILADEKFTVETCKSCHPVTGSEEYGTAELSLTTMLSGSRAHEDIQDINAEDCASCHNAGEDGPVFSEIHSGYDKVIFTAEGVRYADAVVVTVDEAAFDGAMLTMKFSATVSEEVAGLDAADILPTVMVGLYGYDTKDFIIGAHERLADDNADGVIDNQDSRALEYEAGAEHPRFTTVMAEGGSWEVTADLSTWAEMIADGTVKRVEIAVMPELVNNDEIQLALNAPSRTFDLAANAFVDDFYAPIAKVVDGCNNCHEALATTFHSPERGGSMVVCRMCHITKSGGSHLELQSRSLDSYIHAVHSFQVFDIGDIDFNDPVQALNYEHHIGFPFPTHSITNCAACHLDGTNNVPDQSKSLPGVLSGTDPVEDRSIGDMPVYITGPAARACGGCHRAELINEDKVGELVSLNQHMKREGYMVEGGDDYTATLFSVIEQIMAYFK